MLRIKELGLPPIPVTQVESSGIVNHAPGLGLPS